MTSSDEALVTKQPDEVSSEEIAEVFEKWNAPQVVSVTDIDGNPEEQGPLTVEELETLQKEAEDEGYKVGLEKGYQEGLASGLEAGKQEIEQRLLYFKQIITTLNTPLIELDSNIEQDLMKLVIAMTRQFILHELSIAPEQIVEIVRSAIAALPITDRKLKVFLHADDVALVNKSLSVDHKEAGWQCVEDPALTRGGVRLETTDTTIDASVETRINSAINKLLGE